MQLYFMGIGGTAMGNVALIARELGHEVWGADTDLYPPMSDLLEHSGIPVFKGYDPERLLKTPPDRVVVGNVISRGHVEAEWLLRTRRFPFVSLPALLQDLVLSQRDNIVVTGTHGKTTTTCLAAYLLKSNGQDPGYLIGGVPRDLPKGAHSGQADAPFVIEGDEYDSAFFDKLSKSIHYVPRIVTINNVEFDHADIFRDLVDVQRSFRHLLRVVPDNGFVLINGDDPNSSELLPAPWTQVLKVGQGEDNDLVITDFSESLEGSSFRLTWRGSPWAQVHLRIGGFFNARNAAMAALAAGLALNPRDPTKLSLSALAHFQGVKRRQDALIDSHALTVIEDFGHHPTAIRDTLHSLRVRYPDYLLTACFEPRSNTARTSVFQSAFVAALKEADRIFIAPIHRSETLAPAKRLNPAQMAKELTASGRVAYASESTQALLEGALDAYEHTRPKRQLFCFFSNGSFDGTIEAFVKGVTRC